MGKLKKGSSKKLNRNYDFLGVYLSNDILNLLSTAKQNGAYKAYIMEWAIARCVKSTQLDSGNWRHDLTIKGRVVATIETAGKLAKTSRDLFNIDKLLKSKVKTIE